MYQMSLLSLSALLYSQTALAQVTPPVDPIVEAPQPVACCTVPALTIVKIEFLSTINSQANFIGERFPIRLAEPLELEGKVVVPAGTNGYGEIVHAAKSRFGGKPGELILAVRSLDHKGTTIPLRSLRYIDTGKAGQGKDNTNTAAIVNISVGLVGLFITGGEVNIPAGTLAFAKTSADVTITPQPN
jgi:hypothetical protein